MDVVGNVVYTRLVNKRRAKKTYKDQKIFGTWFDDSNAMMGRVWHGKATVEKGLTLSISCQAATDSPPHSAVWRADEDKIMHFLFSVMANLSQMEDWLQSYGIKPDGDAIWEIRKEIKTIAAKAIKEKFPWIE